MISITFLLFVLLSSTFARKVKDAQTCTYPGPNPGEANKFPKECRSTPEGQFCLSSGSCGCIVDFDCWTNTKSPYCPSNQSCSACWGKYGGANTLEVQDHYFCREDRYPSLYVVSPSKGPSINQASEGVAGSTPLSNYYREVCFFSDGSCARCNQANTGSGITNVVFPDYTNIVGTNAVAQKEALWGTVFCNSIRGEGSPKPGRPICASAQIWIDVGLQAKVSRDQIRYTADIAFLGVDGPMSAGSSGVVVGTNNLASGSSPDYIANSTVTQPVVNWEGACIPCALMDFSASTTGTLTPFHYLCSRAITNRPICDVSSRGCRQCASNVECQSATSNCSQDGTASCTGGRNCYSSGQCRDCTSDADCAGDGGEISNQPICKSGVCTSKVLCAGNASQGSASDCAAATPNCQSNGDCIFCRSNSDCTGDLGGQQVCNTGSGLCVSCIVNADCVGTSGANCMWNGQCVDCISNTQCASNDGGLPANGIAGGCATNPSGFCSDKNGQTICNTARKLCEDPCPSNDWCTGRQNLGLIGGGHNCQMSGLCVDCTGGASSPSCGSLDGPNSGLVSNIVGKPNQPDCDAASKTCIDPFVCQVNADCGPARGGNNCQVGGSCKDCFVDYTSSSCSAQDSGEIKGQPNCQQSTRLCIGGCSRNSDCVGTQGNNCMGNQVCLTCRTNADCTNPSWNGDGGEIPGQTFCGSDGICFSPCDGNQGSGTPRQCASGNCFADGTCRRCSSSTECASSDGPPGTGHINTVCNSGSGICEDPFTCGATTDNAGCQSAFPGGANNNCYLDGTCLSCTSNADCYARDGGRIPHQPRCNPTSRVCEACTSNSDCPAVAPNCNDDGFCYDCTKFVGMSCEGNDGPPGATRQPHCDPIDRVCVDHCTQDAHCTDSCYPKCNLLRRCCVECNSDSDCPVAQWASDQRAYTHCDIIGGHKCVIPTRPPTTCVIDADCTQSYLAPACATTQGVCVQCLFDSHCKKLYPNQALKACQIQTQTCVQCVYNHHCPNGQYCESDNMCYSSIPVRSKNSAFGLGASLALLIVSMLLAL